MTDELIVLGILALVLVFVAIYALALPALTRRDLLFGVTVAPDTRSTPAGRGIIARYRLLTVLLTLLGLGALVAIWQLLPTDAAIITSPFAALGIMLPVTGVPYLWAYFAARRLARSQPASALPSPTERPSAELRPRRYGDYVPWLWELLPLVIIGATVVYLVATYPSLPQTYPTHFGVDGRPNGYSTKSIAGYFSLVWTQLGMEALLTLLSVLVVRSRSLPGEAEARFRRAWLRFLYVLKVGTIALIGISAVGIGYSAVSGSGLPVAFFFVTIALLLLALGGTLVLSLRTGQGGARLSPEAPATDRMSDRHWILGEIYVNRNDPSIFVERRFGIGWTLNWGNPTSWLVIVVILALPLAAALVAILSAK